jgi:hypothetical protein
MFVSCVCMLCCPVQVEVSEDGLITRLEESYRVSKYDHAEGKGIPKIRGATGSDEPWAG